MKINFYRFFVNHLKRRLMILLLVGFALSFGAGFFFTDLKRLYSAASSVSENPLSQSCVWLKTLAIGKMMSVVKYFREQFPSVKKMKSHLEVTYFWNGKMFCIHVPIRMQSKLLNIKNQADQDVTEEVRKYLGPHEDFHGSLHHLQKVFTDHGMITLTMLNGKVELRNLDDFQRYFFDLHKTYFKN